jgi:hypothetical protein
MSTRRRQCRRDDRKITSMDGINLLHLPPEIISNILATFCDARSISTFLIVACSMASFSLTTNTMENEATTTTTTTTTMKVDGIQIIKYALLVRYEQLTHRVRNLDLKHMVLPKLMRQIRDYFHDESTRLESIKFFSGHCALLEYFETHLSPLFKEHWLIWCGEFETFYGNVQAYITSPYWSMNAIDSWYRDLELTQFSIVRPRVHLDRPQNAPFGSILGIRQHDIHLLDRLRLKLEPNVHEETDYWKGMMTAIQFAYDPDPPLIITPHAYSSLAGHREFHIPTWIEKEKSLSCYWDDCIDIDDESLMDLGQTIQRLMRKFCSMYLSSNSPSCLSFKDSWEIAKLEYLASVQDQDESDESGDEESQG